LRYWPSSTGIVNLPLLFVESLSHPIRKDSVTILAAERARDNPIGSAHASVLVTGVEAVKKKETSWSGGLRGKIR